MNSAEIRLLHIEDNHADAYVVVEALEESTSSRYRLTRAVRLSEAIRHLVSAPFDAVLLDLSLPDSRGIETFRRIKPYASQLPIVVLSGFSDEEMALAAMAEGAQDYLVKGRTSADLLVRSIRYALERKRISDELIQAKNQALTASRAKSTFLANMSHEIRTPLSGILGMAELLLLALADGEQQKQIRVIKRSASALLEILDAVLDLARIEAGTMTIVPVEFSLPSLIEDIVALMTPLALDKQLSLRTHLSADLPEWLWGDALRLRQVLINLASNAIKFTEEGKIEIKARVVRETPSQVRVALEVRDTGIGIPSDRHAMIFGRFIQADSGAERRYGGAGLGLSVSYELARLLGGSLRVQSEPAMGSTFTFELDLGRVDQQAAAARRKAPATNHASPSIASDQSARKSEDRGSNGTKKRDQSLRILLAEDHEANRMVVEHMLRLIGCTVESVTNGHQAVAAWSRSCYDVVLMDVQMPVMDGLAAAAAIRTLEGATGSHTPILAYTAHSMEEEHRRCLEAGMDDVLTKPIHLEALSAALSRWSHRSVAGLAVQPSTLSAQPAPERDSAVWVDRLLERCLGNRDLARDVLTALLDSVNGPISGILDGLAEGDSERLRRNAHALKGLLLTIGADDEAATCRELEQAARYRDLARAHDLSRIVQSHWKSLESAIHLYLGSAG